MEKKQYHYLKIICLAIILCLCATACMKSKQNCNIEEAPCLASVNIIDRNGLSETINNPERLEKYACVDFLQPQPFKKVLRIYMRDAQGNIPACITSYHPNGYPKQYLEVINSRACGAYKEWHPNGIQKLETLIIEGNADLVDGCEKTWIFDGCSQVWDENGNLEATIPYVKGNLEGVSTYYHNNGSIWKTIPYHKSKVEGTITIQCSDGALLQTSNYCNGAKNGETKRYWSLDQLAAEECYCEGLLQSSRYYNRKGECVASIENGNGTRAVFGKEDVREIQEYHYGTLEGEIKVFDQYGRITNLYHVKNGCKHGEELCFYDAVRLKKTLDPKLSINWYEGKVQGIAKTWYKNGVQESQREMSNNKKNGHSTAWYHDGSLMMIEEYEQDKLIRGEYYSKGERFPISTVNEGNGIATLYDGDGNFINKIEYYHSKPQLDE